jgi:hypothetical protein
LAGCGSKSMPDRRQNLLRSRAFDAEQLFEVFPASVHRIGRGEQRNAATRGAGSCSGLWGGASIATRASSRGTIGEIARETGGMVRCRTRPPHETSLRDEGPWRSSAIRSAAGHIPGSRRGETLRGANPIQGRLNGPARCRGLRQLSDRPGNGPMRVRRRLSVGRGVTAL